MEALHFDKGEPEYLSSLAARLTESPWRWEILLTGASQSGGSAHYRMILGAIRKCVKVDDPNADRAMGPILRQLEKSESVTDREAARLLVVAAKNAQDGPVVNK